MNIMKLFRQNREPASIYEIATIRELNNRSNRYKVGQLVVFPLPTIDPPDIPLEQLYRRYNDIRGLKSVHTRDLRFFSSIIGALIILAAGLLALYLNEIGRNWSFRWDILSVFLGAITAIAGLIFTIYQVGKRRFAVLDVINSEMIVIARILSANNSIYELARLLEIVESKDERKIQLATWGSDLESNNRIEDYFAHFHGSLHEIGSLDSDVVDNVTYFYTFLKASRDEWRELAASIKTRGQLGPESDAEILEAKRGEIERTIVTLLYLLDALMMSATRALNKMVEDKSHRAYTAQLTLSQGVYANNLLSSFFINRANDHDYDPRLVQTLGRRFVYGELIDELKSDRQSAGALQEEAKRLFRKK